MKKRIKTPLKRIGKARIAIIILAASATALACGWSYITDHSVRFNSDRTGRAFYRLPPLPVVVDPTTGKELSTREVEQYDYIDDIDSVEDGVPQTDDPGLDKRSQEVWQQAILAIGKNDLDKTARLLKKYLEMTSLPTPEYGVGSTLDFYVYRNSAYDMLDAMTALKQGSSKQAVKAYLEAREEVTNSSLSGEEFDEVMKKEIPDTALRDNWEYLMDAQLTQVKDNTDGALKSFQKHAAKFPTSEKHEAVLFMIARLTMKQSYSSNAKGCYVEDESPTGDEENSNVQTNKAETEPKEKCQDEAWHKALKGFQDLVKKYPNGRYVNDARGWIANLYVNGEEPALALAEYYRLLGNKTDLAARLEAKKSLQIIGHDWSNETLDKVEELISSDPDTALAYAYHRIYNVAVDHTTAEYHDWCCYGDDSWQQQENEKTRVKNEINAGHQELDRVADFAMRMMKRYPQANVSGGFVLRIAEAQLEMQNFAKAGELAQKALAMNVTGDLRAQALWIKGSSEHEMKKLAEARRTFSQLIAEFPDDKLTEGARRLLAMTAEDQGDLDTALEQYIELKYDYDVAYYVDVLMPTDRLAKFVAGHPNIEHHNELLYALGLRYMRDSRWDEARTTMRQVATFGVVVEPDQYNDDGTKRNNFAKNTVYDEDKPRHIETSWVMVDMQTIDALQHLEMAVDLAQGDEAKAEAMYQLASYQYDANSLLFYNNDLWKGWRYELLTDLQNSGRFRLPNEARTLFEYSESHDTLARSIPIYVEIMERYPQTKAAPDAMFSAAEAHEKLSTEYPYWRDIYGNGMFAGPRMINFSEIHKIYPKFRWPLSRLGWEASTRTVNGGPAYPTPKPVIRLTRTQVFERRLNNIEGLIGKHLTNPIRAWSTSKLDAFVDKYNTFWRGCFYAMLIIIGLITVGYVSIIGLYFWQPRDVVETMALAESQLLKLSEAGSPMTKIIEAERKA